MTPQFDAVLKESGFHHYGLTPLENPISIDRYEEWLRSGLHADMKYLVDHLPAKKNPDAEFDGFHSALVITKSYFPAHADFDSFSPRHLRIAEYARSEDYHFTFKSELEDVARKLKSLFPGEEFLCFTDSVPLLERDLAARAQLGWVGKNSCLVDRKTGSMFFIGEILMSRKVAATSTLVSDFCGTCTRCIDICPTGALEKERVLNANKCISYWTIESKSIPDAKFRPLLGDWFFGCDLCQTVCPWNEKAHGRSLMRELSQENLMKISEESLQELREILVLSNKQLMERLKKSPLSRARGFGLKRNALIVIGNLKIVQLKSEVKEAARLWPRLGELCSWTLECLEACD